MSTTDGKPRISGFGTKRIRVRLADSGERKHIYLLSSWPLNDGSSYHLYLSNRFRDKPLNASTDPTGLIRALVNRCCVKGSGLISIAVGADLTVRAEFIGALESAEALTLMRAAINTAGLPGAGFEIIYPQV